MAKAACSSDPQVALDFARVAVKIIRAGESSGKGFAAAARRLNTDVDDVRTTVSLLSETLLRAAKLNLSEESLRSYFERMGYQSFAREAIASFYAEQLPSIRSVVGFPLVTAPFYKSLEWRLDVQVASRESHSQAQPCFLLKLITTSPSYLGGSRDERDVKKTIYYLQADYMTLREICKKLERALSENKSSQSSRIVRQINL